MFVIFHCELDNCQDIVCCHEPFRWQSFFFCVCERFIIYIIAFPLSFRGEVTKRYKNYIVKHIYFS